jgi:hypothetical protein
LSHQETLQRAKNLSTAWKMLKLGKRASSEVSAGIRRYLGSTKPAPQLAERLLCSVGRMASTKCITSSKIKDAHFLET